MSNKSKLESILNDKILEEIPVSGGCINNTGIIITLTGKKYFVKTNSGSQYKMFINEANGLKEISRANVIRVPGVIYADEEMILLEAILPGKVNKDFFEDFGRKFARLHRFTSAKYGFYENNYIGSTPQINIPSVDEENDWARFYFNKRLKYQFELAEKNGFITPDLKKYFSQLEEKIESIIRTDEKPSLLHGDLWSGNFISDENGSVCLIDPAVYYGNREADLAMTKLFGGFSDLFYSAYNEEFPPEPGYQYRENIYKLYHVFNHLNLFGRSYYQQAVSLIRFYL